jgi:hypothetical protein
MMCDCCARCTWGCGFHIYILSLVSQLIQSHSIAKDAAAKAKKKRAATRPTTIPQNRLNQSHKRKAESQKDKRGSKRSRSDGSKEDEENSDDSENGGGEAAAGLTANSTHNTPLGETQGTCPTLHESHTNQKGFLCKFYHPPASFSDKTTTQEDDEAEEDEEDY